MIKIAATIKRKILREYLFCTMLVTRSDRATSQTELDAFCTPDFNRSLFRRKNAAAAPAKPEIVSRIIIIRLPVRGFWLKRNILIDSGETDGR